MNFQKRDKLISFSRADKGKNVYAKGFDNYMLNKNLKYQLISDFFIFSTYKKILIFYYLVIYLVVQLLVKYFY